MQAVDASYRYIRTLNHQTALVRCLTCSRDHIVERDEDGGAGIRQTMCNHPGCEAMLCSGCSTFKCDFCGLKHCAEHRIDFCASFCCPTCFDSLKEDLPQ